MEEWKKYKTNDINDMDAIIIFFIIGGICDYNVLVEEKVLIPISDIESFSLTILQIQAIVGTLIFTIIALITGNVDDSGNMCCLVKRMGEG